MSFQQWTYLQALFTLLFRSTDSQASHSYGLANYQYKRKNIGLFTNMFGMAGQIENGTVGMAFFWIHDLWGNFYQNIGGVWNRSGTTSKMYYWLPRQANKRAFNNGWTSATTNATQSTLGTDVGITGSNVLNSYISYVAGTNKGGFCPTSQSASNTTYWCDEGSLYYVSGRAVFPYVGGYYSGKYRAGIFYCYFYISTSGNASDLTSRLSYRGGH